MFGFGKQQAEPEPAEPELSIADRVLLAEQDVTNTNRRFNEASRAVHEFGREHQITFGRYRQISRCGLIGGASEDLHEQCQALVAKEAEAYADFQHALGILAGLRQENSR
jgi:hypothetical protein